MQIDYYDDELPEIKMTLSRALWQNRNALLGVVALVSTLAGTSVACFILANKVGK